MLGGKKDPCEPPHALAAVKKQTGRPCPRVELHYQNAPAAELLGMLIDEYKRHLVTGFIGPLLVGRSADQQVSIIRRVTRALHGTDRITSKLYPTFNKER